MYKDEELELLLYCKVQQNDVSHAPGSMSNYSKTASHRHLALSLAAVEVVCLIVITGSLPGGIFMDLLIINVQSIEKDNKFTINCT